MRVLSNKYLPSIEEEIIKMVYKSNKLLGLVIFLVPLIWMYLHILKGLYIYYKWLAIFIGLIMIFYTLIAFRIYKSDKIKGDEKNVA